MKVLKLMANPFQSYKTLTNQIFINFAKENELFLLFNYFKLN